MSARRPTQKDVARLAGVSRVTVSIVLNGKTSGSVPISEETQTRVFNAARELGYAPNPVAQMLKQGSNHILGIFVYEPEFPYDVDNYLFHHRLGVEREAARLDYNVLFFTRNHNSGKPTIFENGMNSLRLADGCIIMGGEPNREELCLLAEQQYPFVCIGRRDGDCEIDWVVDDYMDGSRQAVQHLIDLGHRRIGFIAGDLLPEAMEDKLVGCHEAAAQGGAELLELSGTGWGVSDGLLQIVEENNITALACPNNRTFDDCLQVFSNHGLTIPEYVSVVALTPPIRSTLETFTKAPTYVRLDRVTVGLEAVRLLVKRLNNQPVANNQIYVPCELVVGETTGPPRHIDG